MVVVAPFGGEGAPLGEFEWFESDDVCLPLMPLSVPVFAAG